MELPDTHKQLIAILGEELGPATAQHLVSRLVEAATKPNQVEGVLLLLDELSEVSPKVARAAIESFPDLQQRDRLSDAVAWLDLGVALAESSGAIGMKFFKESPLVLGLIESPSVRSLVLKTALELDRWSPLAEVDVRRSVSVFHVATGPGSADRRGVSARPERRGSTRPREAPLPASKAPPIRCSA